MNTRDVAIAADLVEAGLAPTRRLAALDAVAARYAMAMTPAMADLIDRTIPTIRSPANLFPIRPSSPAAGGSRRSDRRRGALSGRRHRAPLSRSRAVEAAARLPGLLPFLLSPRDRGARTGQRCRRAALAAAMDYIAHTEIWEVILTGGDPLALSPRRLGEIMARLAAIDMSRSSACIRAFRSRRSGEDIRRSLPRVLLLWQDRLCGLHANHPREIAKPRAWPARASSTRASRC